MVEGRLGFRPDPPEKLSDLERTVWRRVVATKPSDWFTADSQPLLVEYCRACVFADQLAEALAAFDPTNAATLVDETWIQLRAMQERNARLLTTLAMKMRLTQQSRYTPQRAATTNRDADPARPRKPWEDAAGSAG